MGHGMVFALNACWSTLGSLVRDKNRRLVFEPRAALVYPPKRPLFSSSTCCFYFYPPTYACRLSTPVLLVYVADARRKGGRVLFFSAFLGRVTSNGSDHSDSYGSSQVGYPCMLVFPCRLQMAIAHIHIQYYS
ncbi:hypothetical protein CKAH01_07463 [Colletotrichum kahawae]|uniref:Uncharacterized protein n=1 Tax=Colletotrichum kahawae TaxID=34407 RepID=A0AAE0D1X3_COLKA|nr:hypothetical protein CKAH01_07463 [Colletotrichum kahawae]